MAGRGPFLVLEGPDGCGKSTQAEALVSTLRDRGLDVCHVREPGATAAGEAIRRVLLDPAQAGMAPMTELFLYMAARAQLAGEVIRPALSRGAVVVSDRYLLSSVVYQGIAGGLGADVVWSLGRMAIGEVQPDVTFVFDVPAEVGLARAGSDPDRMEAKGLEYHRAVCEGYRHAGAEAGPTMHLDGAQPPGVLRQLVLEEVDHVLGGMDRS